MTYQIKLLGPDDLELMSGLLTMFGEAFEEPDTYSGNRPSNAYLKDLLGRDYFVALAAVEGDNVVGGLAAYILHKFEQDRREMYIYDLAVAVGHRRKGIATALLQHLRSVAAERGVYVMFIQADADDEVPIALYSQLGTRLDAVHFDIEVPHNP